MGGGTGELGGLGGLGGSGPLHVSGECILVSVLAPPIYPCSFSFSSSAPSLIILLSHPGF